MGRTLSVLFPEKQNKKKGGAQIRVQRWSRNASNRPGQPARGQDLIICAVAACRCFPRSSAELEAGLAGWSALLSGTKGIDLEQQLTGLPGLAAEPAEYCQCGAERTESGTSWGSRAYRPPVFWLLPCRALAA